MCDCLLAECPHIEILVSKHGLFVHNVNIWAEASHHMPGRKSLSRPGSTHCIRTMAEPCWAVMPFENGSIKFPLTHHFRPKITGTELWQYWIHLPSRAWKLWNVRLLSHQGSLGVTGEKNFLCGANQVKAKAGVALQRNHITNILLKANLKTTTLRCGTIRKKRLRNSKVGWNVEASILSRSARGAEHQLNRGLWKEW